MLSACASQSANHKEGAVNVVDQDAKVIEQMRKAGADLNKAVPIDFYIYFSDQQSAARAEVELRTKFDSVQLKPPGDGQLWLCLATKSMVPNLQAIRQINLSLEALAKSLGGDYDGWEAPIVK